MNLPMEVLLVAGVFALYLQDSALLLHYDEIVLTRGTRWNASIGGPLEFGGRRLYRSLRPLVAAIGRPHGLQLTEAAHVALASSGHAVAQPMFLTLDRLAELVLFQLLGLQHLVTPSLEMGKAAVEPPRPLVIADATSGAEDDLHGGFTACRPSEYSPFVVFMAALMLQFMAWLGDEASAAVQLDTRTTFDVRII